jgi:hypothetical protein
MRMSDLILLAVRRKKRWQDREDLLLHQVGDLLASIW